MTALARQLFEAEDENSNTMFQDRAAIKSINDIPCYSTATSS
jgi:hypothetical protein